MRSRSTLHNVFALVCGALLAIAAPASGTVRYVDPYATVSVKDGSRCCDTIFPLQEATGDTVRRNALSASVFTDLQEDGP